MERELETRYIPEESKTYHSIDGTVFRIGKNDVDFLSQLQSLPALHRVELMLLNEAELLDAIKQYWNSLVEQITNMFNKEWEWRDTGDKADLYIVIPFVPQEYCNAKRFKTYAKKLNNAELLEVLNVFTSDTSEIREIPKKELI